MIERPHTPGSPKSPWTTPRLKVAGVDATESAELGAGDGGIESTTGQGPGPGPGPGPGGS